MYRRRNRQIYRTAVATWLTLSVGSVILAAITWINLSDKLDNSRRTVTMRSEVEAILRHLVDAETSQRGFTITGKESFLEPFTRAQTRIPERFARLYELSVNEPLLTDTFRVFEKEAEKIIAFHENVIAVRRNNGQADAIALVTEGGGKKLMDEIRREARAIQRLHNDIITDDASKTRTQLMRASLTSLVAGVIGIGMGGYALRLARIMIGHEERERQLVEEKLRAERSSQEKAVFLANMSHEIRTPMNAILGFSELLVGELRDSKHGPYLDAIRTSAGSLLQLINDILDMSKIEAGVMQISPEAVDPHDITEFVQTVFTESAARKGVRLQCAISPNVPKALLVDRIRLRQILVNLVGNAVKFTDKGQVDVRLDAEPGDQPNTVTLLAEVRDTGLGIPQDKLESIFKPFVQAGAHRDKERFGTGLGLSIVRRLTEMMHGTVQATSTLGQGSSFCLRLPNIAMAEYAPKSNNSDGFVEADFARLVPSKILVADDNVTNCQLVASMLKNTPHELHFACGGLEAVEKAALIKPDVILMDIRMPDINGSEALERIRKMSGLEAVPIIAVTASALMSEEGELRRRFNGYVRKPFTRRELYQELQMFVRSRQQPPFTENEESPLPAPESIPAELLIELRRLHSREWAALRDTLAVNETRAFAERLTTLADQHHCKPLQQLGQRLLHHAEAYDFVEMEKQLMRFPALVEKLAPQKLT